MYTLSIAKSVSEQKLWTQRVYTQIYCFDHTSVGEVQRYFRLLIVCMLASSRQVYWCLGSMRIKWCRWRTPTQTWVVMNWSTRRFCESSLTTFNLFCPPYHRMHHLVWRTCPTNIYLAVIPSESQQANLLLRLKALFTVHVSTKAILII